MPTHSLDVRGLPEEKVSHLQRLIEQWRRETLQQQERPHKEDPGPAFATHRSRVLGRLTRNEIYDHL